MIRKEHELLVFNILWFLFKTKNIETLIEKELIEQRTSALGNVYKELV